MTKHGIKTLAELHEKSISDPTWFWSEVANDLDIHWFKDYSKVLDASDGIEWTKWFIGGRINVASNCVDKHLNEKESTKTALVSVSEQVGQKSTMNYKQLSNLTNQICNALVNALRVKKGDRVGIFMPMVPETIATFMAVAKMGAVVVPIFSGYGSDAIASRLSDCDAVALVTSRYASRRGNRISMGEIALEAAKQVPTLRSLLLFHESSRKDSLKSEQTFPTIFDWDVVTSQAQSFETVSMDSEDPLMIIYTSGTTGKPKGAVHVHGGFLVKIAEEVAYQADVKGDDVLFWVTDMGWIMAPWEIVGGLCLGCTVLLYDGAPDYPDADRLWQVVEENRVTILGVSPTLIRALMRFGTELPQKHDLSSLRAFGSTGEPWNPESYNWLFRNVGNMKIPIVNLSGGTEVAACFLSVHPIVPIKSCSLGGPCLGIKADVLDESGNPVKNQTGELVVKNAWPSMTRGLWKNPKRYIETYWSRIPGIWVHGDWASIDSDGCWFLHGRSDDTLKISGKRVGPAEIESILTSHPAVLESVAIGVPDKLKGETSVCFVILRPSVVPSDDLRHELRDHVGNRLGKSLTPAEVRFVDSLPKTRNAKLVRRLVRARFLNLPLGDISNIENPEALDSISESR